MSGHFRFVVWDPVLTVLQIATLQTLFYATLGLLIFVADSLHGETPSLAHLFSYQEITVKTGLGRFIIVCYLVNCLCGSLYLWHLVQRAKPCLDFSATVYILHLVICWFYNGAFPNTFAWWILNIICIAAMCVCGEFLCMRSEMKAIPLLGTRADL